jgi:hypothetical protein
MDTTKFGSRSLGERHISLFCISEKHRFCSATQPESCSCDCHYKTTIAPNADLTGAAYAVFLAAPTVVRASADEAEERAKFLELLKAFEPHVDFAGFTAEVLFERLRPTIARAVDARPYWSAFETETDLGLKN